MYDIGSAQAYYRMGIGRARQAGRDFLAEYMLGSLAAFEIEGGYPGLGLTLVGEAGSEVEKSRAFCRRQSDVDDGGIEHHH